MRRSSPTRSRGAASIAFVIGRPGGEIAGPELGGTAPPAASASAPPTARPLDVPPVRACDTACCAGSACAAAKGELQKCASGRTCVGCDAPSDETAFRVRLGNLVPAKALEGASLKDLDLCGRALGGEWSCVPAYAEPAADGPPRALPRLLSAADLGAGVEVEVRPRGSTSVVGRWRDSVRVGPTVLCRGLGALVTNEKKEDVGSLALTLEDPYFVELGRAAELAAVREARALLVFADVAPFAVETSAAGTRRFALVAGPFDRPTAERLRALLLERSFDAAVTLGADFRGAPIAVP